jgi:uncharacterized protein (TIGR03437 family)
MMLRVSLFLLSFSCAWAQPHIFYRGIVNVASSMAPGLPSGSIARGSMFAIYGRDIGPSSSPALSFPLQNTLGGVSITITQGQTVFNAIPVFVSPGQVNAIMPSSVPLGMVSLQIRFNNGTSNPAPVRISNSSFGILTANGTGRGPAIAQNFITPENTPVDTLQAPAKHGQTIILWGTGLGPVSHADNIAPTPGTLPIPVEVFVGGRLAPVAYSGRTPCCSGIDQIVFTVPPDAPSGCWVPLYVRSGGTVVSNFTTMAISDNGPCTEPSNALAATLLGGGRTAAVLASRVSVRQDIGVLRAGDVTADLAGVYTAAETEGSFNFNPMFSLPPVGTCTSYAVAGNFPQEVSTIAGMAPTGRALDPGTVTAAGSKSQQTFVPNGIAGQLMSILGGALSSLPSLGNSLQLDSGPVTISGNGGKDIGAFQVSASVPQPLTWTNRDQLNTINRAQPLTISWSGGNPSSPVFIAGGAADLPNNASTLFLCIAAPGSTSFSVPPVLLANVPAVGARLIQYLGAVYVGQWNVHAPTSFSAPGIERGTATVSNFNGKSVVFQ